MRVRRISNSRRLGARRLAAGRVGLHEGFVRDSLDLFRVALPVFDGTRLRLVWHERVDADPAHRWLKQTLEGASKNARVAATSDRRLHRG